jgi:hypothetical protein
MSDPTKKSIVINKSFLSGSDKSNSSNIQKKSKKNTRNLSEEIIKPNKLKKMLLDKINAKRKADQTSSPSLIGGGGGGSGSGIKNVDTLDISKETRIFSSEFKKSLDFLDSYIGQKRNDKDKNKNKNNTLKKQNTSTSLNTDILKSLHNNNNNHNHNNHNNNHRNHNHNNIQNNVTNSHALSPTNNIHQSIQTPAYIAQPIQPTQPTQPAQMTHQPAPFFQKIQLQIPNKSPHNTPPNISSNMAPKINLAIGKTGNQSLVYTELPPELQNFTPPVYSISSPSYSPLPSPSSPSPSYPISLDTLPPLESYTNFAVSPSSMETRDDIDLREMGEMEEIENNNSETVVDKSRTSLLPSSETFSPVKLSDDSPYGCLKGGTKPTFRTYNKTIKNNIKFSGDENNSDTLYSDRQTKLKELQNKHSKKMSTSSQDNKQINSDNNENDTDDVEGDSGEHKNKHSLRKTKVRRHLRKTITKKFKLGKQQGNIVGVLIKNNDTRKNIQKEHGLLKSKQLADVKKYLVEKNLIKIGSTAPPGVIRNIYEASMLAGEVENVGKGIGLHNFLEDKKSW